VNLRAVEFQMLETSQNIRRNGLMTAAAVSNAAACLFVLGAFVLALWNVHSLTQTLVEEDRLLVYFHRTTELAAAQDLADEIKTKFGDIVGEATLHDRNEVFESFIRANPDYPSGGLDASTFMHKLEIRLSDPERWDEIRRFARADPRVDDVISGQQQPLLKLRAMTRTGGLVLAAFLGCATLLTISNTIRLTIYARRREIAIMQMVGATPGFIRLPFLLEGIFLGTVGAAIGGAALLAGYSSVVTWVAESIPAFERFLVYGTGELAGVFGGLMAVGLLFGLFGSWLSVGRYLREQ
jgi:cell division transport system permease protein